MKEILDYFELRARHMERLAVRSEKRGNKVNAAFKREAADKFSRWALLMKSEMEARS
jgi:hypothetical protein